MIHVTPSSVSCPCHANHSEPVQLSQLSSLVLHRAVYGTVFLFALSLVTLCRCPHSVQPSRPSLAWYWSQCCGVPPPPPQPPPPPPPPQFCCSTLGWSCGRVRVPFFSFPSFWSQVFHSVCHLCHQCFAYDVKQFEDPFLWCIYVCVCARIWLGGKGCASSCHRFFDLHENLWVCLMISAHLVGQSAI